MILLTITGIAFSILLTSAFTVKQEQVAIITRFGKMLKIARTGLNFKIPFIDKKFKIESLQNRAMEVKFQAITKDQANVFFNALIVFKVLNDTSETIQKVAFKFRNNNEFTITLLKSVESSVRGFVANKLQEEVLKIRTEIIDHVKENLDKTLEDWGYHLMDIQMNDITFDKVIMESMAKVVASNNLKAAAENEGQALLITKTKAAQAEGNAIKIAAQAEMEASILRGQGISKFREEVAKGMKVAAETLGDNNAMNVLLFTNWTETLKQVAENGKGNVLFFDGSTQGYENTMKQIQAMNILNNNELLKS